MKNKAEISTLQSDSYSELLNTHEKIPCIKKDLTPSQTKRAHDTLKQIKNFSGAIPALYQIYTNGSIYTAESRIVESLWKIIDEESIFQRVRYEINEKKEIILNLELGKDTFFHAGTIDNHIVEHLERIGMERYITAKISMLACQFFDKNQLSPSGFWIYFDLLGPKSYKKLFDETKRIDQYQTSFIRFFNLPYEGFYRKEAQEIIDNFKTDMSKKMAKQWEFFSHLKDLCHDFLHSSQRYYTDSCGNYREYAAHYQKMVSKRICFPSDVTNEFLHSIIENLYFETFPILDERPFYGDKTVAINLIEWSSDYDASYYKKLKIEMAPILITFKKMIDKFNS